MNAPNTKPTADQVKAVLRKQTSDLLRKALQQSLDAHKYLAAQWVRDVLAERGEAA